MRRGGSAASPSYLAAIAASACTLVLYLVTLAPSTAMWDASEYIAAAHVLGIPHPPGNPFFILLGRVAGVVPLGSGVAMRINVLAAVSSAIAAGAWFLIAERAASGWLRERWQRVTVGTAAALIGATAFTVWNQSVVNEKVYTISLAFFAIVSWLTIRWSDDPDARGADRLLVLIAYLIGLGYANHPAGFLVVPAVAVAVLARKRGVLLRWRLMLVCLAVLALGWTPFAVQPIRAAHFPALNMGEPTGCTSRIAVACTFSATTAERLEANITREQYGKPQLTDRQASLGAQLEMWWLYFTWQWHRDAYDERPELRVALALLFLALGLAGGWAHWRYDRSSFWFFGPLVATVTVLLVVYMNFRYGFSQSQELGGLVEREPRDRDYFYLWSFSAWGVWAALGLALVWRSAASLVADLTVHRKGASGTRVSPERRHWLWAAPVLAIAIVPLVGNWAQASRAGETATRDWAHDLLNSVEPYGILITAGDNDTFPLWYAQEVEGIRLDVTVAVTSLLNLDWYVRQLVRRPVHPYDSLAGPAVYRGRTWERPTAPALSLTLEEVDSLPTYLAVPGPVRFRHEGIDAIVDPRRLQYGVIERADLVVLQLIKDNVDERAVYISRSAGDYGQRLGLGEYLLTQGLARKVVPRAPQPASADTARVAFEGWVDVPRTRALWEEVYQAPESLIAQDGWVDRASVGIPAVYVSTGILLAELLTQSGEEVAGQRALDTALRVAESTRISDMFVQAPSTPMPGLGDSPRGTTAPGRPEDP